MKCPRCGKHNATAYGFHKNNQTNAFKYCSDCGFVGEAKQ